METRTKIRERRGSGQRTPGDLRQALWIARTDIRKSWISFPVAALTALIPGLYLVVFYSDVFGGSVGRFEVFLLDLWLLLTVTVLNVNFLFNRDYYYRISEDNYTKRLAFLLGLPITAQAVIAGRAMYMMLALACSSPAFFLLPYFLGVDLRSAIGPVDYLWFVLMWIGYALFMMGFLLFMWNGLSFQTELGWIFWTFPGGCLLVATVSNFVLDDGLAVALIQLSKAQGPLASGIALALGGAALVLWMSLAQKWLSKRELE